MLERRRLSSSLVPYLAAALLPPYRASVEGNGDGLLTLRIVGLPKNLLGPWHDPKRQRGRAWIPMWYGLDIPTSSQPGERYDLVDLGLFKAPRWRPS
jgi:hypothetical protein